MQELCLLCMLEEVAALLPELAPLGRLHTLQLNDCLDPEADPAVTADVVEACCACTSLRVLEVGKKTPAWEGCAADVRAGLVLRGRDGLSVRGGCREDWELDRERARGGEPSW